MSLREDVFYLVVDVFSFPYLFLERTIYTPLSFFIRPYSTARRCFCRAKQWTEWFSNYGKERGDANFDIL